MLIYLTKPTHDTSAINKEKNLTFPLTPSSSNQQSMLTLRYLFIPPIPIATNGRISFSPQLNTSLPSTRTCFFLIDSCDSWTSIQYTGNCEQYSTVVHTTNILLVQCVQIVLYSEVVPLGHMKVCHCENYGKKMRVGMWCRIQAREILRKEVSLCSWFSIMQ